MTVKSMSVSMKALPDWIEAERPKDANKKGQPARLLGGDVASVLPVLIRILQMRPHPKDAIHLAFEKASYGSVSHSVAPGRRTLRVRLPLLTTRM
jgi:hypothetical protein